LYPNPADESNYLKTESAILQASLIDALGKEQAALPDHENRLDIRYLKPGLYWMKVQTREGVSVQKVVKRQIGRFFTEGQAILFRGIDAPAFCH